MYEVRLRKPGLHSPDKKRLRWILSMYINFWQGRMKMTEPNKSQWCLAKRQQAQNYIQETPQKYKKNITCEWSQMLELFTQRSCGVSILEDSQIWLDMSTEKTAVVDSSLSKGLEPNNLQSQWSCDFNSRDHSPPAIAYSSGWLILTHTSSLLHYCYRGQFWLRSIKPVW